jgi:hypothetical protein
MVVSDIAFELIAFHLACAALVDDAQYAGPPLHILNAEFGHCVCLSCTFPGISLNFFFLSFADDL